jgi:hypothetical protein
MNSQAFIRECRNLVRQIQDLPVFLDPVEQQVAREQAQRRLNQLFAAMQNPSLMAAADLRDAALGAGLLVDRRVLDRIRFFADAPPLAPGELY